jgi:hypothetical protein
MRRLCLLVCVALLAGACSEPPRKEMDHAQGALDAARAAGAEQYAPETFRAARTSLEQSEAAVAQRDYRLALSLAVDASERARAAAAEAADAKARARGELERTTAVIEGAIKELQARITTAEAAKAPARELAAPKTSLAAAERVLQEARAALGAGDYARARTAIQGMLERIREEIRQLDEAAAARAARQPARRRR